MNISRRSFIQAGSLAGLGILASSSSSLLAQLAASGRKPNLLFLITDQQQHTLLHCAGNNKIKTPNLDKLAAGGVLFTQACCVTPYSSPTRASFLTGKYPVSNGLSSNVNGEQNCNDPDRIKEPCETYYHRLSKAGYQCHHLGKYHIGNRNELTCFADAVGDAKFMAGPKRKAAGKAALADGPRPGEVLEPKGGVFIREDVQKCIVAGNEKGAQTGFEIGRSMFKPEYTEEYALADRCIELMQKYSGEQKPFAITLSLNPPHSPYVAPDPYYSMYKPEEFELPPTWNDHPKEFEGCPSAKSGLYLGELYLRERLRCQYAGITFVDACFGRVLDELEKLGLKENTLVVFTSDHGDMSGQHNLIDKAVPNFYEEILRVPLLMRFPGKIPAGKTVDALNSTVDIAPTLLDYLCAEPLEHPEGQSIRSAIEGKGERTAVFSERGDPKGRGLDPCRMVRTRDWKYVRHANGFEELYDLKKDSLEKANCASDATCAATKANMIEQLKAHMKSINDPCYATMFGA